MIKIKQEVIKDLEALVEITGNADIKKILDKVESGHFDSTIEECSNMKVHEITDLLGQL